MKQYQYWTGDNGSIIVCSDGRYASTVNIDADPEHDHLPKDKISEYAQNLIDEAFEAKNWGNWNDETDIAFSIGEMGLLTVDERYTDFFGETEEAIKAYVGDDSVSIPNCFYWENVDAPRRLYDVVNGTFYSDIETTISETRKKILDGEFSEFDLENYTLEGEVEGDSISLSDLV